MASQPHNPKLLVAIGVGPKKGPTAPPPSWDEDGGASAPAGQEDPSAGASQQGGQKVDPQSAGVYTSDQKCTACKWYIHPTHECQKVAGNDYGLGTIGCTEYFTPEDSTEPDGDEGDADDQDVMGEASPMAPQGAQYGGSNTSTSGQ